MNISNVVLSCSAYKLLEDAAINHNYTKALEMVAFSYLVSSGDICTIFQTLYKNFMVLYTIYFLKNCELKSFAK